MRIAPNEELLQTLLTLHAARDMAHDRGVPTIDLTLRFEAVKKLVLERMINEPNSNPVDRHCPAPHSDTSINDSRVHPQTSH